MVFKPIFNEYESKLGFKYECCELIVKHFKTIFIKMNEEGCRKITSIKSWAYCKMQLK